MPRGLSNDETLLVMVHEVVESFMVRRDGVHEAAVNAFDQAHADADEAGALSAAPYHHAHAAATKVEARGGARRAVGDLRTGHRSALRHREGRAPCAGLSQMPALR